MGLLGRPCKEPRCPAIVTGKNRYCEKHKALEWNQGGNRTVEPLTLYNTQRWQKIRKLKLHRNPICEVCNGKFATQVHHLKKARDFPQLAYDMDNLQSICVWCHARETQKETQEKRNESKRTKQD